MNAKTTVAVVDDHQIFREGLIEILQTFDDIEVVASGGSSNDAVRIARTDKPDVIVLDLDMPGPGGSSLSGLDAIRAIESDSPMVKIVVLTMHDDPTIVRRLIQTGISSYLIKSTGRSELHAAIKSAAVGADSVLVKVSRTTASALSAPPTPRAAAITTREREIISALATTGGSNREIAAKLHIAEATVKRHLASVYEKLGTHTRIQTVRQAELLGLLDTE